MVDSTPNPLLGRDLAELLAFAEELQEPSYRAQQLFESIYRQRVSSVQQISTLPARLRQDLAVRGISIGWPTIDSKFQSTDGTVRYLVESSDGETVEAVWMPEGDGGESGDGSEAGDEIESGCASELVVAGLRPAGRGSLA